MATSVSANLRASSVWREPPVKTPAQNRWAIAKLFTRKMPECTVLIAMIAQARQRFISAVWLLRLRR